MLNVESIKQALAGMQKQASEEAPLKPVSEQIDELVTQLSGAMGDGEKREQLQKRAFEERRERVIIAKVLAGLDALAHQER
jgi:hypothetical protein